MLRRKYALIAGLILSVALVSGILMVVPTSAQTTTTDKWCSGVNLIFFPGGSPGGSFESVVYNGALQAAADLGPTVQYIWSDWQPDKMVTQLQQAIATKPDGIAVMGHPGDEAYKPVVDDAEKQGIMITAQNVQLPELEAAYKSNGFGYSGALLFAQGSGVATEAIKEFGLVKGDRAMVWGLLSQAGRGERTRGVKETLENAGIVVDYLEIDAATNSDPTAGIPTFTGYVSAHPDVKLIVTDHGNLTGTLPALLQAAGKKPGDIKTAGFDLGEATVQGIKDGWIGFVNDQQEWLQGYVPILQLCLSKKYGFSGFDVDTGAGFVNASNVGPVADLAKKGIR